MISRAEHYSPIQAGLGFLPLSAAVIVSAGLSNTRPLPRFGPRPLVPTGMLLGAAGMITLTGLGAHSSYAGRVLPALVLLGLGLGFAFASSMNTATSRLERTDAGVGSAMVNTCQQVGGSLGAAALSTVFTSAVADYAIGHHGPAVMQAAALHGYSAAFWWSAGLFVAGAVVTGALFRSGVPAPQPAQPEAAMA